MKHYWQYGQQPKELRERFNTGDILENAAECLKCGDYIRSNNRHDFKYCKCGSIAVDGGSWYVKRIGDPANMKNIIVPYNDA